MASIRDIVGGLVLMKKYFDRLKILVPGSYEEVLRQAKDTALREMLG